MKTITLNQDKMAFLVKNAIAHDSALHDFGGNSKLAYGRLVQVLHNPQGGGAKRQHGGMVTDVMDVTYGPAKITTPEENKEEKSARQADDQAGTSYQVQPVASVYQKLTESSAPTSVPADPQEFEIVMSNEDSSAQAAADTSVDQKLTESSTPTSVPADTQEYENVMIEDSSAPAAAAMSVDQKLTESSAPISVPADTQEFESVMSNEDSSAPAEEARAEEAEPALQESNAEVPYQIINTLSDPNIQRLLFLAENEAGIMDPRVFNPPPPPADPPLYYYLHFKEGTYCAYDFTKGADDTYKANVYGIDRSIRITRERGILINNGNGEKQISSLPQLSMVPPDAITMLETISSSVFEIISAYINTKTLLKSRGAEVLIENIFFRPIVNISADAQAILIDPAQPMKDRFDAASQIILEQDLVTNPLTITVDNILKLSDKVTTIQRGLLPTIRVGTHPLDAGDFIANAILVRFDLQIQGINDPSLITEFDTQINTLDKYIQFIRGSDPTNLDFQIIYIKLAETRDVLKNARDIIEENFKNRDYSRFQKIIENNINKFISPSPTEDDTEVLKGFIRVILEDKNIDIPSTMREIGLIPTVDTLNDITNFDVNTIPETLLLSYYRCVMNCMRYNDLVERGRSQTTGGPYRSLDDNREQRRSMPYTITKGGRAKFNSKFAYIASVSSRNPRLKQNKFLTYITDFTNSPTSNMPYSARIVITADYNPVSPPAPAPPTTDPPAFNINNLYGFYVPEAEFTAALPTNLEQLFKDYNDFPIDNFNINLANDLSKELFNDPETPAATSLAATPPPCIA